jgi:hypothetical protein
MAKIEAEARLVPMGQRPRPAHRLTGRGLAKSVRVRRTLDLDHLCTEIGEQPAEFATCDDHAEIEYPQPVERPPVDGSAFVGSSRPLRDPPELAGTNCWTRAFDTSVATVDHERAGRYDQLRAGATSVSVSAPTERKCSNQRIGRAEHGGDRDASPLPRRRAPPWSAGRTARRWRR